MKNSYKILLVLVQMFTIAGPENQTFFEILHALNFSNVN